METEKEHINEEFDIDSKMTRVEEGYGQGSQDMIHFLDSEGDFGSQESNDFAKMAGIEIAVSREEDTEGKSKNH